MSGIKHDQQKPDLSMIPFSAKCGIAKAFMDGERKYGRYNYLGGMDWTRLLAAVERHISAFNDGEDCAPDSGLNHLYHAGAGICMLIEYYEKQLGTDNRYKPGPKYGSVEVDIDPNEAMINLTCYTRLQEKLEAAQNTIKNLEDQAKKLGLKV